MNTKTKKIVQWWKNLEKWQKISLVLTGVLLFGTSIAWCASC